MEGVLVQVEQACPGELQSFVQCVDRNPRTWQLDCESYKRNLTQCSHTKVPSLAAANKRCVAESDAYAKCLKKHGGEEQGVVVERCREAMQMLHQCTHRTLSRDSNG